MTVKLRATGLTLQKTADELNARGYRTKKKRPWTYGQLQNILKRAA
ncbi:MAG: recombinase family protein [Desulfomonilaceae bacterium]